MYSKKSKKAARVGIAILAAEFAILAAAVAALVLAFSPERAAAIMESAVPAALMRIEAPFTLTRRAASRADVPYFAPERAENPLVYTPPEPEPEPEPETAYLSAEGITLMNRTDMDIDVEKYLAAPLPFETGDVTVLIIHTHATEAFSMADGDEYEPSEPYRTTDESHSVIRVGDELERVLTERGVRVVHDRGKYDYPNYAGSYTRALESIREHISAEPGIAAVIDLHRDALEGADGRVYKTVADIGDSPSAQIELICGTNASGLDHPDWEGNLSFAMKLQARMVGAYPTLARPLQISRYRYNQHASPGSLIVEVGCSGNTLSEALAAVRYFGDCMASVLGK